MISSLFFCCAIVLMAAGERCGIPPICQCYDVLNIVSCKDVDTFPSFNTTVKGWTVFLDIENTTIKELPSLNNWSRIEMITLRGNNELNCTTVPENDFNLYVEEAKNHPTEKAT